MSITVLRQTATLTGLQDQGTPARPMSAPPCRLSGIDVSLAGAGDNGCGEPIEFRTGDTLFFPARTRGEWRIDETLRKVFVVMALG